MSKAEKEVLIGIVTLLRDMESRQRDDATSLLQVVHAFCGVRPENAAAYNNYRPVAERLISQRPFSDQGRLYAEIIERLKGDDAP